MVGIGAGALGVCQFPVFIPFLYARCRPSSRFLGRCLTRSAIRASVVAAFTLLPVAFGGPEAAARVEQVFPDITAVIVLHRSFIDRPEHLARALYTVNAIAVVAGALAAGAESLARMTGAAWRRPLILFVLGVSTAIAYFAERMALRTELLALTAAAMVLFTLALAATALLRGRVRQRRPSGG